jgi:hypothetical protein
VARRATSRPRASTTHRSKNAPCKHVQQAVDVASAGDTISLAAGTYTEQVTISKSLNVTGAGASSSTIASPAVLAPDGDGAKNILEVNSGATVQISKLAVAGPGPAGCDGIDNGIDVGGGASLAITQSTIRDIHDTPLDGCRNGSAVTAGGSGDVGHLDIDHSAVSNYQKNGITVSGAGSTERIDHNTVQTLPTDQIASNGVEIDGGATGTIDHNNVSSRDFGILTDFGNSAGVDHNSVTGGIYGLYEFGGTGMFSHNSASGASAFDMWWDGTGTPSFDHNQCGTASPSKAAWDCK